MQEDSLVNLKDRNYANLVILHCSNSMNFPVLYKKPMIFITTDGLNRTVCRKYIYECAAYFEKKPINISKEANMDLQDELFVYEEGYSRYRHDFIGWPGW